MRLTDTVTPLKPLEAMARGGMVLASDVGGHRELVRQGENGLLFPADDAKALARAIDAAITRRPQWPALGRAARDFVERERSWDRSAQGYLAAYSRALGRPIAATTRRRPAVEKSHEDPLGLRHAARGDQDGAAGPQARPHQGRRCAGLRHRPASRDARFGARSLRDPSALRSQHHGRQSGPLAHHHHGARGRGEGDRRVPARSSPRPWRHHDRLRRRARRLLRQSAGRPCRSGSAHRRHLRALSRGDESPSHRRHRHRPFRADRDRARRLAARGQGRRHDPCHRQHRHRRAADDGRAAEEIAAPHRQDRERVPVPCIPARS